MIGKTILHYKILEKLGEGGMGVVYKAEDTKLKRDVAIKFLPRPIAASDEERARFKTEAQAAAALNHPNIATIHAIEEVDDEMFIVMEYIEGQEIREIVGATGPIARTEAINYANQIAAGLQAAHEKDVTHRDIKSSNIMVTEKGQVKIMDFGLAKVRGGAQMTKVGTTLGTAAYMSPEQAQGAETDHRTDIWAFGVVLYEMLTGEFPFGGDYEQAVTYAIINEEPEYPEDIPANLRPILQKALAKDLNDRYQNVGEVLADLESSETEQISVVSKPVGAGFKPAPTKKLPFLIGSIVVVALLVVAAFFILKTTPEDTTNKKSIAVLPFENLSGKQEEEYFSDGMTEDVLAQIAKIADLKVISRAAIRHYKNTEKSPQEIGAELNVANLLMGTVRRDGDNLRVGCELVEAATGAQLWSKIYDRKLDNVFAIQSEVAQQIAQTLEAELSAEQRAEITQPPTPNLEAYDYYLRGNGYTRRSITNPVDITNPEEEIAIQMYEKAVELDSNFALAYAALARARLDLTWPRVQKDQLVKAKTAVDRAQALAPDLPETHIALGYYFYYGFRDYDQALKHLTIALKRRPNDAESIEAIGWIQRRQGKWQEHLTSIEKAIRLNPRNYRVLAPLGRTYLYMRQYPEAERKLDRAISLASNVELAYSHKINLYRVGYGDIHRARQIVQEASARIDPQRFRKQLWELDCLDRNYEQALKREVLGSDTLGYYYRKSFSYYYMKQIKIAQVYADSARTLLQSLIKRDPLNPTLHGQLGQCYAILERKKEAIRAGKKAVELLSVSRDALSGPRYIRSLAEIYTLVGEHDAAIDQLAYLLSIPSEMTVHRLRLDPVYDPLRGHPRFQELLAKYSVAQ